DARSNYLRYFQLASEILARSHEGRTSCCSELTGKNLVEEFLENDRRLGLLNTFERLRDTSGSMQSFKKNTLLIFRFDVSDPEEKLTLLTFDNVNRAIDEYDRLEKELGNTADIVLVRGETEDSIRDAFRNYFSDARAFVDLMKYGLNELRPTRVRGTGKVLV
ncbi:hypothetical protein, partial [Limimaricola cinnabarinus]|uniref:hypothetical protein n=1 Tax=Limimaricola cinnabarinus TaxID=1125964 RepID=UPI002FDF9F3F